MQTIFFAGSKSWGADPGALLADFIGIEKNSLCIASSPSNADIVFVKETIDSLSHFSLNCLDVKVRVFWGQEAVYPDFNIFDYAISFPALSLEESRYSQMHPLHFFQKYLKPSLFEREKINDLKNKNRFCDFIYSNPNAHPFRDQFFLQLSKHMYINSPGKHLRNCDEGISRKDWNGSWREDKISYQSNSYFSIAFENACFPGYTSEKIITSFLARSIPIYWGDKYIEDYFNPASFVHFKSFQNLEQTFQHILSLYDDQSEYLKILNEPILTDSQFNRYKNQMQNTQNFILNILYNPQVRRPLGTFPALYEREWAQRYCSHAHKKKKFLRNLNPKTSLSVLKSKCKLLYNSITL